MNDKNAARMQELFREYREHVKPLLAEVESTCEMFPIQIHNEARNFMDHISQCYADGVDDSFVVCQLDEAAGHIDRMILDCYKFLNVYAKKKDEQFTWETRDVDLTLVSNGTFYLELQKLRRMAEDMVRAAKYAEAAGDHTYIAYEAAHYAYDKLQDYVKTNLDAIDWCKRRGLEVSETTQREKTRSARRTLLWGALIGLPVGVLGSFIAAVLFGLFNG